MMSGQIRQSLGVTTSRLKGYLALLPNFEPKVDPSLSREDNLIILNDLRLKIISELKKIKKSADLIETKNDEWAKLTTDLQKLNRKELADEEIRIYEHAMENADNFMVVWSRAQEVIDLLEMKLFETEEGIENLKNPVVLRAGPQN